MIAVQSSILLCDGYYFQGLIVVSLRSYLQQRRESSLTFFVSAIFKLDYRVAENREMMDFIWYTF